MDRIKLTIGTPVYQTLNLPYVRSILGLATSQKYDCKFLWNQGSFIHQSRNSIFYQAAEGDYLLFVDADIVFSAEDLEKLIALDKDIAAGYYFVRYPPYPPVVFNRDEDKYVPVMDFPKEPFTCDGTGMGFMLIKTIVIREWCSHDRGEGPFDYVQSHNTVFGAQIWGEDISFCQRMREMGKEIWIHPNVCVGHLSTVEIRR